jgi:hypothetical protein
MQLRSMPQAPPGYAFTQTPIVDLAVVGSAIEKSKFREKMDEKSAKVRNGIAKTFAGGKKKEKGEGDAAGSQDSGDNSQGPTPAKDLPPLPVNLDVYEFPSSSGNLKPYGGLLNDLVMLTNGDTEVYFSQELYGHNNDVPLTIQLPSRVFRKSLSPILQEMFSQGLIVQDITETMYSIRPISPLSAATTGKRSGDEPSITPSKTTIVDSDYGDDGDNTDIKYCLHFNLPESVDREDPVAVLRYDLTTRNFMALICGFSVPLVGRSLFEALNDLKLRTEVYYPSPKIDAIQVIVQYLKDNKLDDVRDNPVSACSLLAWCDQTDVQWEEGWIETFVHCTGMFNRLEEIAKAEFQALNYQVRINLQSTSDNMLQRIEDAESNLVSFDILCGDGKKLSLLLKDGSAAAKSSYENLRKWFCTYYQEKFAGDWPRSKSARKGHWLTPDILRHLQNDFGHLYGHLVDRSSSWEEVADSPDFLIENILAEFDKSLSAEGIPCPFSLVPEPSVIQPTTKENIFKAKKATKPVDENLMRKLRDVYFRASNVYQFNVEGNDMVEHFVKFECSDQKGQVDPSIARRTRWVLIYGILQTLAGVSVQYPDLNWSDGVSYHLCPQIKYCRFNPEVATKTARNKSYCWVAAKAWAAQRVTPSNSVLLGDSESVVEHNQTYSTPYTRPSGRLGHSENSHPERAESIYNTALENLRGMSRTLEDNGSVAATRGPNFSRTAEDSEYKTSDNDSEFSTVCGKSETISAYDPPRQHSSMRVPPPPFHLEKHNVSSSSISTLRGANNDEDGSKDQLTPRAQDMCTGSQFLSPPREEDSKIVAPRQWPARGDSRNEGAKTRAKTSAVDFSQGNFISHDNL